MSDITTRAGKGSPLTNAEVDANFENLNADKLESVSQSDVTQHQAALSITESQISDLDKYTQSEVDALLASLEAYDQSLNTTDDVAFASLQLTGGTGDQGTVTWNTDEETLDVVLNGATLQMGQEVHYHVRNNTGSTILDGTPVYATGTLGASGRITVAPYIANGTIPAKYFLGVTTEDIADGTDGKVTHFGKIRHVDTSAFSDGDVLYPSASTAGALTATAPTGSNIALPIAIVINSASNGTLFVRSTNVDDNAYATAAQGALADSALQSGDNVSELTNDAGYATTGYVDTAESDAVTTANAYTDTRETAITTAYQTYADQAEADAISTAAADATSKANTAESNANSYTDTAVAGIVDTAPATLDTLNELAAALGDDPNFATTVSTQIGTKLDASHDMTLTLAGDASGSATFTNMGNATLTVAVADDSHNHTIANVDGLQAALDGKVDDSQVLTNVPAGAVFTDTVYSHPAYAGDDFSVDTGALTGATVVSDIDINVTTDGLGHVTDANATVATRNLTLANLGYTGATNANYYTHPSYAGDDINLDTGALSGATVISDLDFNVTTDALGHVTDANATYSTRNLTLSNLGAGSLASLSSVGAAQITDNSVGAAELNVSGNGSTSQYLRADGDGSFTWATPTDTNTTYSAGSGLDLSGTTFSIEPDLRDNIDYIGKDSGDYLQFVVNSYHRHVVNGAERMRIESDGDLHADGDVIAYSTTISDERLKDNVEGISDALIKVGQLNGYTFKYKADGKISAGVIAQEVEEVLPEAVTEKKLPLKTDDDGLYKVVNYDALHGLLIEAVKELTKRVEELEAK
jgi:hypothetical protein